MSAVLRVLAAGVHGYILGAAPTGGQRREKPGARPRTPPPPNPADAEDARPLGASATHSKKIGKTSPRAAGPVAGAPAHDARRLASWGRPRRPKTRHSLGNGCETRARSERPPRGPARPNGKTRVRWRHGPSWLLLAHS